MRIVHAFRSPVGGIFRHVRDLAMAQHASGHEVAIICDSTTGGTHEEQLFQSIERYLALGIHRVAMQRHIGLGDVSAAANTFQQIKALQPDILHGHGAKGGFYSRSFGTLLKRRSGTLARIYSPHGGVLHYDARSLAGRAYFQAERQMERLTDHIFFVSKFERETYEAKIGIPRTANTLVYNGVQESEFERVVLHPDAADFLYIGMMRDLKGPDLFIEALARVRESFPDLTAHMVGDGDDLPRYRKRVGELGLPVTFHSTMPARAAFQLARTMVVPSRAEAMPYIVLEALAAGRPMIATSVGGIPEVLGPNSLALAQPTITSLAEKMAMSLSAPGWLATQMPDAATLRSLFSATAMAAHIESVYRTYV